MIIEREGARVTTIGVLGATGYTGRLVVAELARRGVGARLGGRDEGRLAALASPGSGSGSSPGSGPGSGSAPAGAPAERMVVDVTDAKQLGSFLDGLDAVISCVGPFAIFGDAVVDAAVAAGVPYVDSTGESSFMAGVYDRHADAPVPVVPACGLEFLPSDLAAALAAERAGGEATDVLVCYLVRRVRPSRGTARTMVTVLSEEQPASERLIVDFPDGRRQAVTIVSGEALTVPRHLPGARVRTAFAVAAPLAHTVGLAGSLVPHVAPLVRRTRPLLDRVVERLPEGPSERAAGRASARILARARGAHGTGAVIVEMGPGYPVTAVLLVEAALRVAGGDVPAGALSPAQAFDARAFLDAVSGRLLSWRQL
jgi:short subunit dehydrogenase-like uncharacterized protein